MADFEPCFEKVILIEGGYKLHEVQGDRGGMTYAGIARNFWPKWPGWAKIDANEFDGELTRLVRVFFKAEFWDRIRGDDIGRAYREADGVDVVTGSLFPPLGAWMAWRRGRHPLLAALSAFALGLLLFLLTLCLNVAAQWITRKYREQYD